MRRKLTLLDFSLPLALAGIWTFFALNTHAFISPRNLSMLAIELSITAVLSLGVFFVLVPRQIDLSVGSGVGLIGGIAAVLIFHHHWPALAAMLAGLLAALALWTLMGTLIVRQRVPSFIITLGGLLVFKGVFWLVIDNSTVPVTEGPDNALSRLTTWYFPPLAGYAIVTLAAAALLWQSFRSRALARRENLPVVPLPWLAVRLGAAVAALYFALAVLNRFRGLPLSLLILCLVAFAAWLVTQHTRFGRYLYAIGGNREAALLSGIPIAKVIISAYVVCGALVALTGFLQVAYAGASTTTMGNLMELDAIAACVIGGVSLNGGRGTVPGVMAGSLIMTSLLNGMGLMAVAPETKFIARGAVLVLAVLFDSLLARRQGRADND